MFHLFKRVYLDLDDAINLNVNRYVISKDNGVSLLSDLAGVVHAELIDYAKSLDDMIGEDKKYPNLLSFLNEVNRKADEYKSRIVIYCDRETFLKLTTKWIKIILPNVTPDDAYGILSSSMFMTRMFGTSEEVDFTRPYRLTQVDDYVSPQEFHPIFNSTTVEPNAYNGFVTLLTPHLSFEYLLASYFVKGTHKQEVKNIILGTLKDGVQQYVFEAKSFILQQLLAKGSIVDECQPTITYELGNLDLITQDPAFDIWFDSSLWELEGVPVAHSSSQFRFDRLTPSQLVKLMKHLELHWKRLLHVEDINDLNESATNWKNDVARMFDIVIKNSMSDSDLDYIMQSQLSGSMALGEPSSQFGFIDIGKFNMPLLNFILRCVSTNNQQKINSFVLA